MVSVSVSAPLGKPCKEASQRQGGGGFPSCASGGDSERSEASTEPPRTVWISAARRVQQARGVLARPGRPINTFFETFGTRRCLSLCGEKFPARGCSLKLVCENRHLDSQTTGTNDIDLILGSCGLPILSPAPEPDWFNEGRHFKRLNPRTHTLFSAISFST